jgi:hypothetical protein
MHSSRSDQYRQVGGFSEAILPGVLTDQNRPLHSSVNSDDSTRGPKTKFFHIEFSDLHFSKEDSIKPGCDQLECQLFKAEYLADEDSVLVPADVAAIVPPS